MALATQHVDRQCSGLWLRLKLPGELNATTGEAMSSKPIWLGADGGDSVSI